MQRNTFYKATLGFFGLFFFTFHQADNACAQTQQQTEKPPGTKKVRVIIETDDTHTTDEDMEVEVIINGEPLEHNEENVWVTDDGAKVKVIKKEVIVNKGDDESDEQFEIIVDTDDLDDAEEHIWISDDGAKTRVIKKEVSVQQIKDLEQVDGKVKKHIIKVTQTKDGKIDTLLMADGGLDIDFDIDGLEDLKELGVELEELLKGLEIDVEEVLIGSGSDMKVSTITIELTDADAKETAKLNTDRKAKGSLEVERLDFFPNPSSGLFDLKLELEQKGPVTVEVFNTGGQSIYKETIKNFDGQYQGTIDLGDATKGTYFIQVQQGKQLITKKLVVQ